VTGWPAALTVLTALSSGMSRSTAVMRDRHVEPDGVSAAGVDDLAAADHEVEPQGALLASGETTALRTQSSASSLTKP
jgi:hypothetical protein